MPAQKGKGKNGKSGKGGGKLGELSMGWPAWDYGAGWEQVYKGGNMCYLGKGEDFVLCFEKPGKISAVSLVELV